MILYQFSNAGHIFFIIIFAILLLASITVSMGCLPMVKLLFQKGNPAKAKFLLLPIIIVIYLLCTSLFVFSIKNISQCASDVRRTDVNRCSVVTGEIEDLEKIPQYSRGANLTSYHVTFKIDGSAYYIDTDIGVTLENIDLWNIGDRITVHYKNLDSKNVVVLVTKEP